MSEPFIGEIRMFPFNFAPNGWAKCDGQFMSLRQNSALFAVIRTTYGGDGINTFRLPDLMGRMPLHVGTDRAPGLSSHQLGEQGGEASVTLRAEHLPSHLHLASALTGAGTQAAPGPSAQLADSGATPLYTNAAGGMVARGSTGTAGAGQPHNNMPPYLSLNFCIALQGVFPSS